MRELSDLDMLESMMDVSSVGLFLGRVVGFLVGRRLYGLMIGCRLVVADWWLQEEEKNLSS